jgi:D-3-phosphoglycerate dehydrogenase
LPSWRPTRTILQQYARIPRSTIEKLKVCKAIYRYGTGVDIVDVEAAYEHGMVVTNVPDYAIDEVADHSISLALMLIRRIPWYAEATRAGRWHWSESRGPIQRLRDSTWGLIGFGRIAQNIARKVRAFNFHIIASDPYVSAGFMATYGAEKVDFETLLARSAVVNVMCPYTPETEHLINEQALRKMKKSAVLIDCSRGKIVDDRALYRALSEGWIASAGLDDTEEEPAKLDHWDPADNPLFSLRLTLRLRVSGEGTWNARKAPTRSIQGPQKDEIARSTTLNSVMRPEPMARPFPRAVPAGTTLYAGLKLC